MTVAPRPCLYASFNHPPYVFEKKSAARRGLSMSTPFIRRCWNLFSSGNFTMLTIIAINQKTIVNWSWSKMAVMDHARPSMERPTPVY